MKAALQCILVYDGHLRDAMCCICMCGAIYPRDSHSRSRSTSFIRSISAQFFLKTEYIHIYIYIVWRRHIRTSLAIAYNPCAQTTYHSHIPLGISFCASASVSSSSSSSLPRRLRDTSYIHNRCAAPQSKPADRTTQPTRHPSTNRRRPAKRVRAREYIKAQ